MRANPLKPIPPPFGGRLEILKIEHDALYLSQSKLPITILLI
jgi:hypothetical protein